MSNGDRDRESPNKGLATAVIVLVFVGWVISLLYEDQQSDDHAQASGTDYEKAVSLCTRLGNGTADTACIVERLDAQQEQKRNQYDLNAQQDMARWALLMLFVTGVGVVYVAQTLNVTNATLDEAQKATSAAVDAAQTARRQLENERAWLLNPKFIEPRPLANALIFGERSDGFCLACSCVNFGRSPAIDITYRAQQILLPADEIQGPFCLVYDEGFFPVLAAPPNTKAFEAKLYLTDAQVQRLNAREIRAFIGFQCRYNDIYSESVRETANLLEVTIDGTQIDRSGAVQPNWVVEDMTHASVQT